MVRHLSASTAVILIGVHATTWAAAPTPTNPTAIPATIAVCHIIKDTASRLKCFDSIPLPTLSSESVNGPVETSGEDKVIAKWSGSGQMSTRPFHVDGPWELQWNTAKGYFSATLHRMSGSGSKLALLANGMESGSSSSYQPAGGDFYIEFSGMQPWSARVVSVPSPQTAEHPTEAEEPLLNVAGDQSGLPTCDGVDGAETIKHLVESSPLAQTMHLSVIHVGKIVKRSIKDGMTICRASMLTNGGEAAYDFQYYRKDGGIYIYGKPVSTDD